MYLYTCMAEIILSSREKDEGEGCCD
jgi:hypothetical protein